MPSIPQSLLWISLVVLWLFVLVPMLISKRDAVRRTSDVALATRVLNTGRARTAAQAQRSGGRPSQRPGLAAIRRRPRRSRRGTAEAPSKQAVVVAAASPSGIVTDTEPDYLDVDIVEEDSGALPIGESGRTGRRANPATTSPRRTRRGHRRAAVGTRATRTKPTTRSNPSRTAPTDEYEYVDDSSGLEAPSETDLQLAESMTAARRRRYESKTAAAVSARKYKFRKRMLALMALVLVASASAAFALTPVAWWVCGSVGAVTLLYLAYLRRQTRIEERLRRRRMQRLARSRLGVENTDDSEFDVVPSRLRRPGSVVLEIDDEDPIFEHLDYGPSARDYDLPRAAGQ